MKKNEKRWKKIIALVFGSVILASVPKSGQEVSAETITEKEGISDVTEQEAEFEIKDGVLLGYRGSSAKVVVPEGVKEIVYISSDTIKSIEIPSSVISIGEDAFNEYENLEEIIVSPDNPVYSSVDGCLYNKAQTELLRCPRGKQRVEILSSVTCIGYGAFYDCTKLERIDLPEYVTVIGECTFKECYSLKEINIPSSVKSIGSQAFAGCDSLEEVKLPNSVKRIGTYAFYDCTSLREIKMPKNVKSIGSHAFEGCESLKEITIPKGVKRIGKNVFADCKNLEQVTITKGVKIIQYRAFIDCKSLKRVTIPASVTSIDAYAFKRCKQLTIYGKEGSYAQRFAQEYGIPFSRDDI